MYNMGDLSKIAPLEITEEAQNKLLYVKLNKNVPKSQRLRVRSKVNLQLGILGFDMGFDESSDEGDGIYQVGPIEIILDNATAYHLMGSTLEIDAEGNFSFKHHESLEGFDPTEEIVFN